MTHYKIFDQFSQTVKKKTTVLIIVSNEFFQTSIPALSSVLYAKRVSRFSVETFLPQSAENFRRRTLLCFKKFLVSKIVSAERGGLSRFSIENFLSHSAKKFHRGTLQCFFYFGYRKMLGIRDRGREPLFSVEIVLSHSAENFRSGILQCLIKFGYRKMLGKRDGGANHDFPSKLFCLTVPKYFASESFSVLLVSGFENICL